MKRIKRNSHLLTSFHKLNKQQQKSIVQHLDKDQIKFISEICINLLNQNVPLSDELKKKLLPHKCKIRNLACKQKSLKTKKVILQKGGFIPLLLTVLAETAISSILGALANKVINKDG